MHGPDHIPTGETPALRLGDGTLMTEAGAIQRYMETAHPGRKILGETALEQGLDQMWDQRIWTVSRRRCMLE